MVFLFSLDVRSSGNGLFVVSRSEEMTIPPGSSAPVLLLPLTGVCVGIYYEGIYMVKVILTEIRHFECPNEKVEENRLVTKSSILSMESLGWPNTQIQIHKYTNMCI